MHSTYKLALNKINSIIYTVYIHSTTILIVMDSKTSCHQVHMSD